MASLVEKIEADAKREFAEHVITLEASSGNGLYSTWRCAKPGTGIMAFWITTVPTCIIVTGDVGDLIVQRHGSPNMIPWCRGSIHSLDYFAEKVPQNIETKSFDVDLVHEWAKQELADYELDDYGEEMSAKHQEMLRELIDDDELQESEVYERISEYCEGCDFPDFGSYTARFLWCREAIRWFVNNLKE